MLFYKYRRWILLILLLNLLIQWRQLAIVAQENPDFDFIFNLDRDTVVYADLSTSTVQTFDLPIIAATMDVSPKENYTVVFASRDQRLCVWGSNGQMISCLPENLSHYREPVWASDGESFWIGASEADDTRVILHIRVSDGAVLHRIEHDLIYKDHGHTPAYRDLSLVHDLVVSTNGAYVYLASLQDLAIVKIITINDLIPRGQSDYLRFSPNGEVLAMIIACHAQECERQHRLAFYDFAADKFEFYDIAIDRERYAHLKGPFWSPDGNTIALTAIDVEKSTPELTDDYVTLLFDISTHSFAILNRDRYELGGVQWSPDGQYLASVGCYPYGECKITIFDLDGNTFEVGVFELDWDFVGSGWIPAGWIDNS